MPDFSQVELLRPGQAEALIQLAHADCGIIVAATAFGKSFVITQVCRMYPTLRILIVSPTVPVVNGLHRNLEEALGNEMVGQAGGGKRVLGRRCMVTTTKSMHKVDPSEVDMLLFDEVHGVGDNEVAKTLAYYDNCRKYGFTASPVRGDKSEMCMEAQFGQFLTEVSYQEAVEMGNVVPIDVYMVQVTGQIRDTSSMYEKKRLCYWTNDHRNDLIAKVARKVPEDQQCLIMVETLEHAVHLHKRLPDYTLVHFGAVQLPYYAHEWKELSRHQMSCMAAAGLLWIRQGASPHKPSSEELRHIKQGAVYREPNGEEQLDPDLPKYGWVGSKKTGKQFLEAATAAGRRVQLLGRLSTPDELQDVDLDKVQEGDYYLCQHEEYILDVPKSSLKLTKKDKEALEIQFEKAELMKVIATCTWRQGVDFPQLKNLIRADGASSEVNNTQMPGRLSRLFEGKENGKMIDFRDEFNAWAEARTRRRLTLYRGHGWTIHN